MASEPAVGESLEPPETEPKHSGRLLVRMPATLHDELARHAEREGVSLNQLITGILAGSVEWRSRRGGASPRAQQRVTRALLVANLVVVALAAAVALALLVVALR